MPFSSLWRQLPLGNSDDPGYVALRPTDSAEDNGSATHRDDDLPLTQEKEIPQPRRKLISHALGVMTVLMPSFLQPKDTKQRKLHSTAWLGAYSIIMFEKQSLTRGKYRRTSRSRSNAGCHTPLQSFVVLLVDTLRLDTWPNQLVHTASIHTSHNRGAAAGYDILRYFGLCPQL